MVFYGIASLLRGFLIYHSEYLPKFLGVLFVIAGSCFVIRNFLYLLLPEFANIILLLPMFLAVLSATIWFLVKGVDHEIWKSKVLEGEMKKSA